MGPIGLRWNFGLGNIKRLRLLQYAKAVPFTVESDVERTMFVNALQSKKAMTEILVTEFAMTKLPNLLHPTNAEPEDDN